LRRAVASTLDAATARFGTSSSEDEDDLLDRAWGLTPLSRLSCQAKVGEQKLVIEIPKYTINYAKEATK